MPDCFNLSLCGLQDHKREWFSYNISVLLATSSNRCNQPLNMGVGNANLPRWYFNPLTQQCQSCVYKGLQGNENNFVSKQDCENSCLGKFPSSPSKVPIDWFPNFCPPFQSCFCIVNPCQRGVPYKSQGITVQCSANNQAICPAGYYCHLGADPSTSVCCQALGKYITIKCLSCRFCLTVVVILFWSKKVQIFP